MTTTILAPAKVNLCLKILGKDENNYHLLESVIGFCEFGDQLTIQASDQFSLTITGPFSDQLQHNIADNLCMKATHLFQKYTNIMPLFDVRLEKNMPIAAGIGGGSSDAAALLLYLNKVFDYPLDQTQLKEIAMQLGADVPVCLEQKTCFVSHYGEDIDFYIEHDDLHILLVNPMIQLSTKTVFSTYANKASEYAQSVKTMYQLHMEHNALSQALTATRNDLLEAAIECDTKVQKLLEGLMGVEHSLHYGMSGSGATCFVLFSEKKHLEDAYQVMKEKYPDYWIIQSKIKAS